MKVGVKTESGSEREGETSFDYPKEVEGTFANSALQGKLTARCFGSYFCPGASEAIASPEGLPTADTNSTLT